MNIGLYIPCYNAQEHIADVLKAVFAQTLKANEVVVVDDGSNDKTAEIARNFPVRLIRHSHNKGLAAARNTAINNLQADYIAALDADCVPEPNWLEKLTQACAQEEISGAGGRLLEKHTTSIYDQWRAAHMRQYWEKDQETPPFLFGSNTVFRKRPLEEVGLYNENFKNNYEDVDICQRLKKNGYNFNYEPQAVVYHFKQDTLATLFNSYWQWHLFYYKKENFYSSPDNFIAKLKDNIGLANRYLNEDMQAGRERLLYLDFLLALHHSIKDFEFFAFKDKQREKVENETLILWLSLFDLAFSYHYYADRDSLFSFMAEEGMFFQNTLGLMLVVGAILRGVFTPRKLREQIYLDFYRSFCPQPDYSALLLRLSNLIEREPQWNQLCLKAHPYLDRAFLSGLASELEKWMNSLKAMRPDMIKIIEKSAQYAG